MTNVIETERLVLRRFRESDIGAVADAMQEREIVRMIPRIPWPYTTADAENYFAEVVPQEPESFAVEHNGALIGAMRAGRVLGYWLRKDAWGRGFATEAARAAVGARFAKDIESLRSGHRLGNERSRRVLRKLGFRDTGQHMSFCNVDQTPVTLQDMELSWADWQALQ